METRPLELDKGERFEFGDNWSEFLKLLNEERIERAKHSLCQMLKVDNLKGKRFLDIGSGSGLFSLAAYQLGASVHSFDYDPQSVACTRTLRQRFASSDDRWSIEQGSALDRSYLDQLGEFDIVYSWGVLHHTGHMWEALQNTTKMVAPGGQLFIALYDDQGKLSRRWHKVKKFYCAASRPVRGGILAGSFFYIWGKPLLADILKGKPFHSWRNYGGKSSRGMSPWRDMVDWVGGYPFEVAQPQEVIDFYQARGYKLQQSTISPGGCNEFVFLQQPSASSIEAKT